MAHLNLSEVTLNYDYYAETLLKLGEIFGLPVKIVLFDRVVYGFVQKLMLL